MTAPISASRILLFSQFLNHLRQRGFIIGIEHYLRLQRLLDQVEPDCEPDHLKTLLCPIFATSRDQQEQFYLAFDSWLDLLHSDVGAKNFSKSEPTLRGKEHKQQTSHKRSYIWGAIVTVLVVAVCLVGTKIVTRPALTNKQIEDSIQDKANLDKQTGQNPQGITGEPQLPPDSQPQSVPSKFRAWWIFALLVSLLPLILLMLARRYGYNRDDLIIQRQKRKKPPYTWPIKVVTAPSIIYDPEQFYKATRLLQHRLSDEYSVLDIQASVAATVESLGHTVLCYKPATKSPEYLVLIERASFNDHQSQFFNFLAKRMDQAGLFWACYFYADDPRLCWDEAGEVSILVEDLQHKYPKHRLLILGDGKNLIDPITGKLGMWVCMFSQWDARAILTPEAPSRWGWQEIVLADQFMILPATLEGIMLLSDYFERPQDYDIGDWMQTHAERQPELNSSDAADALRTYLGEDIFQWLCACAVYPELHWDLTLHIGLLLDKNHKLVNEQEILKLLRLSWFRQGFIPDDWRLRLLHELAPNNERLIRQTIINLLERSIPPPTGAFAADVHLLNLTVQRWLYYGDRKTYGELLHLRRTLAPAVITQDQTVLRLLKSNQITPFDIILPSHLRTLFNQSVIFVLYRVMEDAVKLSQKLLTTITQMHRSVQRRILKYLRKPLLYFRMNHTNDRPPIVNILPASRSRSYPQTSKRPKNRSLKENRGVTSNSIKILFLAANPVDVVGRLRIDKEVRQISERIHLGARGGQLELVTELAVRPGDLQAALLRHQPDIVHFSGHGGETSGIMLESDDGNSKMVNKKTLSNLFWTDSVRVVVLNACYAKDQAQAFAATVDFTVGLNAAIEERTAVMFAAHFYQSLTFGFTVTEAFELAVNQLLLEGSDVWEIPELLVRDGVDAAQSRIVRPLRPVEPDNKAATLEDQKLAMTTDRARPKPIPVANFDIAISEQVVSEIADDPERGKPHLIVFLPWMFASIATTLAIDVMRRFLAGNWPDKIVSIVQTFLIAFATIAAILTVTALVRPANPLIKKVASLAGLQELRRARRWALGTGIVLILAMALWLPLRGFARYYNERGVGFQYSEPPDLSRARESYQQALRLDPSYAPAHYNLATVNEDLRPEEAMAEYLQAIKYDSRMYPAYINLARLYLLRGQNNDYENALNILNQVTFLAPQDENVQYSLNKNFGWANYVLKKYGLAEVYLRRAIALRKQGAAAHCLLAYVLKEQGKAGVADECFDCVSLAPGERDSEPKWVSDAQDCLMRGGRPDTSTSSPPTDITNDSCGRIVLIEPKEPKGMLLIQVSKGLAPVPATEGMLVHKGSLLILASAARATIVCADGRKHELAPGPQGCPCGGTSSGQVYESIPGTLPTR
jgi:CHAT domain/TPR repeat